ncbi:MAG: hypothetical protein HY901_36380 [Deltaproteobacteria bacterium]|nr:hypothetical protein [Deltaproteobacteria bacterium]
MRLERVSRALVALLLLAGCPKDGADAPSITALDRATHEPKLPIAEGAHATADCNDCHGAFDTFTRFDCLQCHGQAKTDAIHGGNAGYAWDSGACLSCHPQGKAESGPHTAFPIGEGTRHVDRTCSRCHIGATRQEFSCLECHAQPKTDADHSGMPGYAYDSPQCYACHPTGEAAEHNRFPIGAGTSHVDRTCTGCHTTGSLQGFSCLSCHPQAQADPEHASVPGYAWESRKCYECHPTGEAAVDHQKYFPIGQGDDHAGLACSDCHTVPGQRPIVTCNVCHAHPAASMAAPHAGVGGFDSASELCMRCHADSQVDRVAAHLPFRIGNGTGHTRTSCLACHPQRRADKAWAADFARARVDCLSCHRRVEMDDQHQGMPTYQYQSLTCITGGCHADGSKPGD